MINRSKNYVDGIKLSDMIRQYYVDESFYDQIWLEFQKIAIGLTYHEDFIKYSQDMKEDLVSFAVINMIESLNRQSCDIEKYKNSFGYWRLCARRRMVRFLTVNYYRPSYILGNLALEAEASNDESYIGETKNVVSKLTQSTGYLAYNKHLDSQNVKKKLPSSRN